jgi:predicted alpha/beta hydrolase family esterase
MKSVILLHDAFTHPTNYWYSSVGTILPTGYTLITPELPLGPMQGIEHWMRALEPYQSTINRETIFITHGISSLLLLQVLKEITTPVRSCIIVAGCAETPEHKVIAPIAETFLLQPFDWKNLQQKTTTVFHIWNSQDPFVDIRFSKNFATNLPGKNYSLTGKGHFQETVEPELFEVIALIFDSFTHQDTNQQIKTEQEKVQEKKNALVQSLVPGITTYDSDVANNVAGYKGSVISELLSDARQEEVIAKVSNPRTTRNTLYIVGIVLLLIGSIATLGYTVISQIPTRVPLSLPEKTITSRFLPLDKVQTLNLSQDQSFLLRQEFVTLQSIPLENGAWYGIIPVVDNNPADLSSFAQRFDFEFPLGFAGTTNDYVYGFYQDNELGKVPFFLVRFDNYEILHTLMSNWEKTILTDLLMLMEPSATQNTLLQPEPPTFSNVFIKNIPFRKGVNGSGQSIAYGFISDTTLLITPEPMLGEHMVRRLIGR